MPEVHSEKGVVQKDGAPLRASVRDPTGWQEIHREPSAHRRARPADEKRGMMPVVLLSRGSTLDALTRPNGVP
jgi:hypothetical protein